jgi:hypothetical protein
MLLGALLLTFLAAGESPVKLDPENPHYFFFRGRPTVLITSGEHYGAVINLAFDYKSYLDTLALDHLNLTRTWIGSYREVRRDYDPKQGKYAIDRNPLAPEASQFIAPWSRSTVPGALDGGNKFDLDQWNPAFFSRLKDFLHEAGRRNIVVELTLFCSYYEEYLWAVSPLNAKNNINGAGTVSGKQAYTLIDPNLLKAQDALARKIVEETQDFDNVYFEVCNEPYWGNVSLQWQQHMAKVIRDAESQRPVRHMIAENVAQGSARIEQPDPNVSVLNFHYSRPPESVALNYKWNRAIGINETGFDGSSDSAYRIQAWDFLVAGGALYNNLDFSFTVGHERGNFVYQPYTPGGGSAELRRQLRVLIDFFNALPLREMAPANDIILKDSVLEGASVRALAKVGQVYVIYLHNGHVRDNTTEKQNSGPQYAVDTQVHKTRVIVSVPAGSYDVIWMNTKTSEYLRRDFVTHAGGSLAVDGPSYTEDVVLWLTAERER